MKKKNGFVMIETVIMASIISIFLISTFAFTSTTIKKYELRKRYDQIDAVYNLNTIRMFLYRFTDLNTTISKIDNSNKFIKITSENTDDYLITYSNVFDEDTSEISSFISKLMDRNNLNLDSFYITNYDFSDVKDEIAENDAEFKDYLNTIDIGKISGAKDYRLIGKFNDKKDNNKYYYANLVIVNSNNANATS